MFWVYVIQNPDGRIYTGQTDRLDWRIKQHNDPSHTLTRSTKRFPGPWLLIHSEQFSTRAQAMVREKALKSGQGRAWLNKSVQGHVSTFNILARFSHFLFNFWFVLSLVPKRFKATETAG